MAIGAIGSIKRRIRKADSVIKKAELVKKKKAEKQKLLNELKAKQKKIATLRSAK